MEKMEKQGQRYPVLDVLRGMTVALMIIVNTPGSWEQVYAPLLHAPWHGFTPTDLVFPAFLFAVGNALSFTLPKYAALGESAFLLKTLRRTLLIFAIGVVLYWLPFFKPDANGVWQFIPFQQTRIPGVLQRIALCFGCASLLAYYLPQRAQYLFALLALPGYWLILSLGGDLSMAGNAARKFDLALLGASHLYQGEGMAFDPEGILGTIPATLNVLAGYWVGQYLQSGAGRQRQTLLLWGLGLCLLAVLWHPWFPINKKLWTSSYVLLSVGLNCLWLVALLQVMEGWKISNWCRWFEPFGRNTLLIYLFSQLIVILAINLRIGGLNGYDWLYQNFFPAGKFGSLLYALCALGLCWLLAWGLHRMRWYWRV